METVYLLLLKKEVMQNFVHVFFWILVGALYFLGELDEASLVQ